MLVCPEGWVMALKIYSINTEKYNLYWVININLLINGKCLVPNVPEYIVI